MYTCSFTLKHLFHGKEEGTKISLKDIKQRAEKIKNDPDLRHAATSEQIKLYDENCRDLEFSQFETMLDSGWRRMKQISENAMREGNFTVEDVRKDLKQYRQMNYELFKFADIISDVIVDYINGESNFESDREVLRWIEESCIKTMDRVVFHGDKKED